MKKHGVIENGSVNEVKLSIYHALVPSLLSQLKMGAWQAVDISYWSALQCVCSLVVASNGVLLLGSVLWRMNQLLGYVALLLTPT